MNEKNGIIKVEHINIKNLFENINLNLQIKEKIENYYFFCSEEEKQKLINILMKKNFEVLNNLFKKDLEFGTGGLRGIMDVGTSNINEYTIAKASYSVAEYFKTKSKNEKNTICISYDTRKNSKFFAQIAAIIMVQSGFQVFFGFEPHPTPLLSFAIRETGSQCGIMITASHNPKEYNGFKVYNETGCQILSHEADKIIEIYKNIDNIKKIDLTLFDRYIDQKKINHIDEKLICSFINTISSLILNKEFSVSKKLLKVVYTSLHGTGINIFKQLAEKVGFHSFYVENQIIMDNNFSNVKSLNPEDHKSFSEAIELAKKNSVDLVIATDPDADRVGFAFKENNGYYIPTGNEIAIMLFYYICMQIRLREIEQNFQNKKNFDYYAVTTIVTTDLFEIIGRFFGVEVIKTLTGFKYIGEQINLNEDKKFVFAAEESNGYLVTDKIRDKDSFSTINLALELMSYLKSQNLRPQEYLNLIYKQFGYYKNELLNLEFNDSDSTDISNKIMNYFKNNPVETISGNRIRKTIYYLNGHENFPKSNLIQYFGENFKVTIRPSGTEPKLKIYLQVVTQTDKKSKELLETFKNFFINLIKEEISKKY